MENKSWTATLIEDGDDLILQIPDEIMEHMGLSIGDKMEWTDGGDGSWILSKKELSFDDIPNLEKDIKDCYWMVQKVRNSDEYARNLYAALCNNEFIKNDFMLALKGDDSWSCTWRYAGGVISDIRCTGSYMDWYCSGNEGAVQSEIKEDLNKLGWKLNGDYH